MRNQNHETILSNLRISDVPSAPQNVQVTSYGKSFAEVSWDAPEDDGGVPVTSYLVERKDISRTSWIRVNEVNAGTMTCTARQLVEGNKYLLRVSAINDIGQGPCTEIVEPVTAKCPFGKFVCLFHQQNNTNGL